MNKKTLWLVSYEYEAVFYYPNRVSRNAPATALVLMDEHPAVNFAKMMAATKEEDLPRKGENYTRVDYVTRVYSVTEAPPGTLTAEQMEAFN